MKKIIITRHKGLVEYIAEQSLLGRCPECGCRYGHPEEIGCSCSTIHPQVVVIEHATPADVAGQNVWGVLPMKLAALAASVTEIPLRLTPELRGVELTCEQVEKIAGNPVTYRVEVVK